MNQLPAPDFRLPTLNYISLKISAMTSLLINHINAFVKTAGIHFGAQFADGYPIRFT